MALWIDKAKNWNRRSKTEQRYPAAVKIDQEHWQGSAKKTGSGYSQSQIWMPKSSVQTFSRLHLQQCGSQRTLRTSVSKRLMLLS